MMTTDDNTEPLTTHVREFVRSSRQRIEIEGLENYNAGEIAGSQTARILHYGLCELYDYVCERYGDKYHFGLKFNGHGTAVGLLYVPRTVSIPDTYLKLHVLNLIERMRTQIADNLIWKKTDSESNLLCLDREFPNMPRLEKATIITLLQARLGQQNPRSLYHAKFHFNLEVHPHTIFWDLVDPSIITN